MTCNSSCRLSKSGKMSGSGAVACVCFLPRTILSPHTSYRSVQQRAFFVCIARSWLNCSTASVCVLSSIEVSSTTTLLFKCLVDATSFLLCNLLSHDLQLVQELLFFTLDFAKCNEGLICPKLNRLSFKCLVCNSCFSHSKYLFAIVSLVQSCVSHSILSVRCSEFRLGEECTEDSSSPSIVST